MGRGKIPNITSASLPQISVILTVELGPAWFVEAFSVSVGDKVTIVGERVSEDTFVAYSVTKNEDGNAVTLTLRDANGKPVWSGTPSPKPGNQHQNRNRVTLRDRGNGNGNASSQGYESGPRNGNQWGRDNQNQAG
ncbi:MAG: hypothetical protein ABDK87_04950 [Atribacterota bacterium]